MEQTKKRRKSTSIDLLLFVLIIVSAGFLLYPTISLEWNKRTASEVVSNYQDIALSKTEEEYLLLKESSNEYNKLLLDENIDRWAPTKEMHQRYLKELRLDTTNVMGSIEIPSITMTAPIYHSTEEKVLQTGIGHMEGSSLPTRELSSHCVLAGHRGLKNSELFTHLDKVEKGDHFIIRFLNEELWYRIDTIRIVEPEDTDYLKITKGMNEATLVTCTPLGINTHRFLVHGVLVDKPEEADQQHPTLNINFWIAILVLVIYFTTIIIMLIFNNRKDPNKIDKEVKEV